MISSIFLISIALDAEDGKPVTKIAD